VLKADNGDINIVLNSGEVLRGKLHEDFKGAGGRLLGRCFDLKAAYKQCAVHPADAAVSVFAHGSSEIEGGVAFYRAHALPFGSGASVVGFNRAAAGLKACMNRCFSVPVDNFFDDYPVVAPAAVAETLGRTFKKCAEITGWVLRDGDKDKDFAPTFDVLGVVFDLTAVTKEGALVVKNTETRTKALCVQLSSALSSGRLSAAEAAQLAGRLQFASAQVFGRCGAAILWHIRRRAEAKGGAGPIDHNLRMALMWWRRFLGTARPRVVALAPVGPPLLLFTDGFCEGEGNEVVAGIGAVLLDPADGFAEAFGAWIPPPLMEVIREGTKDQVIAQAELLPLLAARKKWRHRFEQHGGRRVLNFIDNDGARFGLIKGYSPTRPSAWLIGEFWEEEAKSQALSWFARVPSPSNCADGPSRLCFDRLKDIKGWRVRQVPPPSFVAELLRRQQEMGFLRDDAV
jgi:hypothetical protein